MSSLEEEWRKHFGEIFSSAGVGIEYGKYTYDNRYSGSR